MPLFTAAVGVFTAISSFIGGLGAVGSFLLKTAVGIGLNLLAQAIAGKPKDPTFAINGTLQAGGDIARSLVMGRTATAGSLVWANTWGKDGDTPNAYLTQVIALADLPVAALDEVWVNGEKVTLGPTPHAEYGYPATQYNNGGADHLWVKFYDGTQTAADSFLVTRASNSRRQWQSTRVGRGVAYAIVTAKVSKNMFSGIPNFKFVVSGSKLYDPSKDSTVPGGSGSHRWSNPATWGGDGDHLPAVQIYNLLRGIQYNGQWFYGLQGMTGARLPTANWIRQINKCRAVSSGNPTYRAGGEIPVEAPLATAIEALLTACQGRLSELGGFYDIYVGEPDAPVASFSDGDILSTEEQSFTPFFGLADTINGIAATYPSPDDGWAVKSAPPLYRADLEALAGNRRLMADVSLDFVPYAEQVQRLMKSALAEGQRARRHTLVLPPAYWPYAVPGAVMSWTSERNGYVNKLFRVDGAVDRANLDVMIDITEVDPADYNWNPATDFKPPVDGAIGVIRPAPQPLIGWQVFPAKIGRAGKELPSIRVAYPGQLDDVRAVRVQVRLAGETAPFFDGDVPYGDPATNEAQESVILGGTFAPATDHQVRGILVPYGSRETTWSEWLPVKTDDVWIYDVYPIDLDRLEQDVTGYLDWVGSGVREIERRLEEFDLWMADQDFGNAFDRQQIRQQLTATFDTARAEWKYDVDVVASATSALSQRVETLTADVGNNSAAITAEATARANADAALASDISSLDAAVFNPVTGLPAVSSAVSGLSAYAGPNGTLADAVTALSASSTPGDVSQANMRMGVMGGPSGYSRIGFETRYGGAGGYRGAAFGADTPANPSQKTRFWVRADQTVVMDSAGNLSAMFDGGSAYFNNARIRNLDAINFTAEKIDAKLILQDGSVIEDLIDVDTFSRFEPVYYSFTRTLGKGSLYRETGWTHHGTVIVNKPSDKPCIEFINLKAVATLSGTGDVDAYIIVRRNGNATSVTSGEMVAEARAAPNNTKIVSNSQMRGAINAETSIRYDIWTWNDGRTANNSTGYIETTCDSGVWVFR